MTKRFVVATGALETSQAKALKDFIDVSNDVGWWHWLPNFWLIKDHRDKATAFTAYAIRVEIQRIAPGVNCLVMEINEDITWSGVGGKNPDGKSFFDWLKNTWPD
jgi:hypothetical protein